MHDYNFDLLILGKRYVCPIRLKSLTSTLKPSGRQLCDQREAYDRNKARNQV